jgi:hypothetical protein
MRSKIYIASNLAKPSVPQFSVRMRRDFFEHRKPIQFSNRQRKRGCILVRTP